MQKLHKLIIFKIFDKLCVKLKYILSATVTYPIKKPTGQRNQFLFSNLSVLIHANVEKLIKIALENQKL